MACGDRREQKGATSRNAPPLGEPFHAWSSPTKERRPEGLPWAGIAEILGTTQAAPRGEWTNEPRIAALGLLACSSAGEGTEETCCGAQPVNEVCGSHGCRS